MLDVLRVTKKPSTEVLEGVLIISLIGSKGEESSLIV